LTLGLIDALAPVPGPVRLAVTGTMAPDGTVGPVGGLRQEVAAAQAAGATMIIVPADEVAVAQPFAPPQLRIVGVANLDEALVVLAATKQP
jgi:PDZ domain-containing protein